MRGNSNIGFDDKEERFINLTSESIFVRSNQARTRNCFSELIEAKYTKEREEEIIENHYIIPPHKLILKNSHYQDRYRIQNFKEETSK